ncbi:MAG: exodeoxyribonuclease VII large subunit [Prevotella sp.]|nr:exodeoxyribonuclease VII large subunit [Prevotella sp.]
MQKHLTLYELNGLVRKVIETTLTQEYWVEAELSECRENHGHCYMELIEKDGASNTPIAKASAKCWRSTWMVIRPYFERITGQSLAKGMKVLLRVYPQFHEQYGFSWIVTDINPEFTLGDMARKRQEIIRQLKSEGVFDLQKELVIPMFAQNIAVISSATAAGYGDFCNQLSDNDYGFVFQTELFTAVMQGERVEESVIAALDRINDRIDDFDVVVIIRGGGGTADFSGFDTLALAENVANFPLPIITGIGHDRDECVLDMVSNTRVKTPTAAAALLIDNLARVYTFLQDAQNAIVNNIEHALDYEKMRLDRLVRQIPLLFSMVKTKEEARLENAAMALRSASDACMQSKRLAYTTVVRLLHNAQGHLLDDYRNHLKQLELQLRTLDPKRMLRYGYSITRINGHAIRDAKELKPGSEIETTLEKGTIKSIVR